MSNPTSTLDASAIDVLPSVSGGSNAIDPNASLLVRLVRFAMGRGSPTHAAFVVAVCLLKYGIGVFPTWQFMQTIAQNWENPAASPVLLTPQNFRLSSSTSAVLAGMFHLTGGRAFLLFHLLLVVVALSAPFALAAVRRSGELRLMVTLLSIGSVVPAVLFQWVGGYDPVTIFAAAIGALAESPLLIALAWAIFGFNNAPEAAIALAIMAVVLFVDRRRRAIPRIALMVAGVLVGYIGIRLLESAWGIVLSPTAYLVGIPFSTFLDGLVDYYPLLILATLGVGWFFFGQRDVRNMAVVKALFATAFVCSIAVPLVVVDQSRILAGVFWAPVLFVTPVVLHGLTNERRQQVIVRLTPIALAFILAVECNDQLWWAGWRGIVLFVRFVVGQGGPPIPFPTIAS